MRRWVSLLCAVAWMAPVAVNAEGRPSSLTAAHAPGAFFFPSRAPASFEARGSGGATRVSEDGVVLAGDLGSVRWSVLGATGAPRPERELPTRVHELVGPPSRWRQDLPAYRRLSIRHEAMEVTVEPLSAGFKYAVSLPAGTANPRASFLIDGADSVRLSEAGDAVLVQVGARTAVDEQLRCVQSLPSGSQRPVSCRFTAPRQIGAQRFVYDVQVLDADPSLPVEIDPYFHWVSYVGSSEGGFDQAFNVGLDPAGNVLVAGFASSASLVPPGASTVRPYAAQKDGFLLQAAADGESAAWVMFLGGDGSEEVHALAVDGGRAYLGGSTTSADFPLLFAFDSVISGSEGWVTAIDLGPTPVIAFSSFIGGDVFDDVEGIAARNGYVFLTGHTDSTNFPVSSGAHRTTKQSEADGYVARLTMTGTLVWATYFGGNGADFPYDVEVDASLNCYVVGWTDSADFPKVGGISSTALGGREAFALRLSASGATLDWSLVHSSATDDEARAIHFDATADVLYVGGFVTGPLIPIIGPDQSFAGSSEAFLSRIRADGSAIDWLSYFGGEENESIEDVGTDLLGNVYATGVSSSGDLPALGSPDALVGAGGDAFVVRFRADGLGIDWSTFVGGESADFGASLAVADANDVVIAGFTSSSAASGFPIKGGFDGDYDAPRDGFVARVRVDGTPPEGVVNDGPAEDVDAQESTTSLQANWPSVIDPESGVAGFAYAIGSTPGGAEVVPFVAVGTDTAFTRDDLSLVPGATYFVTVRAENREGLFTDLISDGITVGSASPDGGGVPDGGAVDAGTGADGGVPFDGGAGGAEDEPTSLIGFSCTADAAAEPTLLAWTIAAALWAFKRRTPSPTERGQG